MTSDPAGIMLTGDGHMVVMSPLEVANIILGRMGYDVDVEPLLANQWRVSVCKNGANYSKTGTLQGAIDGLIKTITEGCRDGSK